MAFVGTTAGVYTLNNKYVSLFEFDFRDDAMVKAAIADSLAVIAADSLNTGDSLLVAEVPIATIDKEMEENLSLTKSKLGKVEQELNQKEKELERLKDRLEQKENTEHEAWLKSTIKLYEAMDISAAGKLLSSLPELEARELIYSMKQKKAAAILSSLDTETVKRLTRSKK